MTPGSLGPYFRASRKFLGPAWLTQNGESELLGYALDAFKDGLIERTRKGHLARFPQNDPTGQTTAPDDALAEIGRDRRIVRGINEPSTTYAVRLIRWLDDWKTSGNPFALMHQLRGYLGSLPLLRTVDARGNWYTLAPDGTKTALINQANWDWDGDPSALVKWSRFWVVIYPNGLWTQGPNWGDVGFVYGTPGQTWGSTATLDEVVSVRSIVSDWKPAGTRCVNIIIAFDNASFDPTTPRDGAGLPNGAWGGWAKYVGGIAVPARLSTARYWDGI